ncbi:Glycosyltransferase involved in cell wall bisynthesis [Flavobacterium gillisiae]|uniref:Glycosyltransferase involved in cell wall bisynthesis n=1 Tax=Flavobacterium gillisiae TaxID=150146 RepID=A0A1H4EQ92_9FLAO|nr:glycosyltransferase family A protein [Flavobacterium gillisiae]SEA87181.1 Glycosyltransferase involved in cell wall bisynthesis [Flavobacterium gillisiae]
MVSVIIPMYNAQDSIIRCLESVIKQTYHGAMEIIIINDGSTDGSAALVDDIIKNNNSLIDIQLVNKDNGGVSSARNKGLALAQGEYIALLDSDDEWLIDKVEKQLDVFCQNSEIGFVGGLINKPSNDEPKIVLVSLSKLIFKNYFQPSTVMFKKEVLDKVGFFDETQKYAEEGNYFMRVADNYTCALLNEQLVLYGQGKVGFGVSGLSANLKEMEKGELKNLSFAYQQNYISLFTYAVAVFYSVLKYFRRILIVKIR